MSLTSTLFVLLGGFSGEARYDTINKDLTTMRRREALKGFDQGAQVICKGGYSHDVFHFYLEQSAHLAILTGYNNFNGELLLTPEIPAERVAHASSTRFSRSQDPRAVPDPLAKTHALPFLCR
jgi:hypothetical protein